MTTRDVPAPESDDEPDEPETTIVVPTEVDPLTGARSATVETTDPLAAQHWDARTWRRTRGPF